MDVGEIKPITLDACEDLYLIETGMYDVTGYGGVYLLDADEPILVESGIGTNYEAILDAIRTIGLSPADIETIAVTHVHLDHAGGAGLLAAECQNATVVVSERGAPHLIDPERLVAGTKAAVGDQWRYYVEPEPVPEDRVRRVAEGDRIDAGNYALTVHEAPGHARHQVVFSVPAMDAVFTGDAAGLWLTDENRVHQTSPPPEFDLEQAIADAEMIRDLEPQTLLFTHFGPATNAKTVLSNYPRVLREWVDAVADKRERYDDEAAVIAALVDENDLVPIWGERKAKAETTINARGVIRYLDRLER